MKLIKTIRFTTLWILIQTFSSCGLDLNGGGTYLWNEVRPSGTPTYRGTLLGLNGQYTATGAVYIFFTSGSYVLRFEGLSVASGNNLAIRLLNSQGTEVTRTTLKGLTGNQNYPFSAPIGSQFGTIYIFSTQNSVDYATAQLVRNI